jgi:hypothetical protein
VPQQPQQQQHHAEQQHPQQAHQQPSRPQPQPQQHAQQAREPQRSKQQALAWQNQRGWQQNGGWQGHSSWQQDRSHDWQHDHRNWAQRGGYGGYFIPQSIFNLHFGTQHYFRISSQPVMYEGYPRFDYGGFSFILVDPWPDNWPDNWYAVDDLYIVYDNGYYLYNRQYPGPGLAISVVQ